MQELDFLKMYSLLKIGFSIAMLVYRKVFNINCVLLEYVLRGHTVEEIVHHLGYLKPCK